MEQVVGNCGKHPGFNMVNCPMCEIERQPKASEVIGEETSNPIKYCVTRWHEILKVNYIKEGMVSVSDPDAIDAGVWTSANDIFKFWEGWRPKDKMPEKGKLVSCLTKMKKEVETTVNIMGMFDYDVNSMTADNSIHDYVILWHEKETVY